MSNGSLEESQNYLRRCRRRELIDKKTFFRAWNLSIAVSRMLASFIARLEDEQKES